MQNTSKQSAVSARIRSAFPSLRHADDIDADSFDNGIDDDTFAKIVACIRIAVPYTGMIISTRESKACRERVTPPWRFSDQRWF